MTAWSASRGLAAFLSWCERRAPVEDGGVAAALRVAGRRCLELGAGTGVVGLRLAELKEPLALAKVG